MTASDPWPIPPGLDPGEAAARFLAGLGADVVAAVRSAHVAKANGDCRGCGWQVVPHWPCVHAISAQRAGELLAGDRRRMRPGAR